MFFKPDSRVKAVARTTRHDSVNSVDSIISHGSASGNNTTPRAVQHFSFDNSSQGEELCRLPLLKRSRVNDNSRGMQHWLCWCVPKRVVLAWLNVKRFFVGVVPTFEERVVQIGGVPEPHRFCKNIVCNQKYSLLTFFPQVLYEQFRFFFNLYFLLVAATQLIPALQIGFLFTYVAPLSFVLAVTMAKEAWDDFVRYKRDKEANSTKYSVLTPTGCTKLSSAKLEVGHIVRLHANERVPADMVMLRTSDPSGSCFIRTDQLDGETDWKLRHSVAICQKMAADTELFRHKHQIHVTAPHKLIHSFQGVYETLPPSRETSSCESSDLRAIGSENDDVCANVNEEGDSVIVKEPLDLEHTLWCNTVIASGTVLGIVVFTGAETRAAMNTRMAKTKVGKTDLELNLMSKMLFLQAVVLAFLLVGIRGFDKMSMLYLFRFVILFSSIIPISLRVNLDLARTVYSWLMEHDQKIPGTIVRTSTIPEELARVSFVFTDKTGTLTQNDMTLKRVHVGFTNFSDESFEDLLSLVRASYAQDSAFSPPALPAAASPSLGPAPFAVSSSTTQQAEQQPAALRRQHTHDGNDQSSFPRRSTRAVEVHPGDAAVPLVFQAGTPRHISPPNTPPMLPSPRSPPSHASAPSDIHSRHAIACREAIDALALCHSVTPVVEEGGSKSFQAASPDEIALVEFAAKMGVQLESRDTHALVLSNPLNKTERFELLHEFPFTSERKRMGIVLRCARTGQVVFLCKGADSVMTRMVESCDWVKEECEAMSREGLRTLVVARKELSAEEYAHFAARYNEARASLTNRAAQVNDAVATLECELRVVCVTGVEDRLQVDVRTTLETLRYAGVNVWMLTGDKVETAMCVSVSSRLVTRIQDLCLVHATSRTEASRSLNKLRARPGASMVVDGESLKLLLTSFHQEFLQLAVQCPAVVACRCSPTQKAEIVEAVREFTKLRVCAIGDGGNDVSMIQSADVGIGIVGKEGKQASLAADFSVTEFSHIKRLLLWHGRNSYKRTARLSQFVIHRGLIISVMQAVFSALFFCSPIPLFTGWLMVGYATLYTMLPVFSLILDQDVDDSTAFIYPELYHDIQKGRSLNMFTFTLWQIRSVFQGGTIVILSVVLFETEFIYLVTIAFTALVLIELLNVATQIRRWHALMVWSEIVTVALYFMSVYFLDGYFDLQLFVKWAFWWRLLVIVFVAMFPVIVAKEIRLRLNPPVYSKLM